SYSRPNEPVDFDAGPFTMQGMSPSTGKPMRYYNFDAFRVAGTLWLLGVRLGAESGAWSSARLAKRYCEQRP
ncbi:hypothetical protein ACTFGZ_01495, partial [Campylobacter jejuni]